MGKSIMVAPTEAPAVGRQAPSDRSLGRGSALLHLDGPMSRFSYPLVVTRLAMDDSLEQLEQDHPVMTVMLYHLRGCRPGR